MTGTRRYRMTPEGEKPVWASGRELREMGAEDGRRAFECGKALIRKGNPTYDDAAQAAFDEARESQERLETMKPPNMKTENWDKHEPGSEDPAPRWFVFAMHRVWGPDVNGNFYSRGRITAEQALAPIFAGADGKLPRRTVYADTGVCSQTSGSHDFLLEWCVARFVPVGQGPCKPFRYDLKKQGVIVHEETADVAKRRDL